MEDTFISDLNSRLTSRGLHTSWVVAPALQRGASGALPASMQDWEVHWSQIEMQRFIGRGGFGRVRTAAATYLANKRSWCFLCLVRYF